MKMKIALSAVMIGSALTFSACGNTATKDNAAAPSAQPAAADAEFQTALAAYRDYVIKECDALVTGTDEFNTALKSGDWDTAKKVYAPARMHYERIEPIAEALGDLDPNIDARDGDVDPQDWRGFHRIEQGLWSQDPSQDKDMGTFTDRLSDDVKLLRAKVETVDIDASLLMTGAVDLLNEVSSSKVTGEEERYSHTDMYDFVANVEGAKEIFKVLEPQLKEKDAGLADTISQRFDDMDQALAPYKDGDGYVLYNTLTEDQTKKLSQTVDALAEPLSQMGKILGE